jgi:hypothetical protein
MWTIQFTKTAAKAYEKLPLIVRRRILLLVEEMKKYGPVRGNWKNYRKLSNSRHHCHLKTGQPTYVAVWEVVDNKIKFIEVCYVGTHEKAPY